MGNVALRSVVQVALAFRGLVLLPIITQAFGIDGYGVWSQIVLTASLVLPFLTLNLSSAIVRFIGANPDRERRAGNLMAILILSLGMGFLVSVGAYFGRGLVSQLMFGRPDLTRSVIAFVILLLGRSLFTLLLSSLRAFSRFKFHAVIQVAQLVLDILVVLAMSAAPNASLRNCVLGLAAVDVALVGIMLVALVRSRELRWSVRWKGLLRLMRYSIPLILATALYWIVNSSDRYVIVHVMGLEQAGVYSAAYQLCRLLAFVSHPIAFVLLPLVARLWESGKRQRVLTVLSSVRLGFFLVAVPACVGLALLGPEVLELLGSPETSALLPVVLLLLLGGFFVGLYELEVFVLYLYEETMLIAVVLGVLALLNLGLNILIVPRIGILGASITTCMTFAAQWLAVRALARRRFRVPSGWRTGLKSVAASAIMAAVVWAIPLHGSLLSLAIKAAVGFLVYVVATIGIKGFPRQELSELMNALRESSDGKAL